MNTFEKEERWLRNWEPGGMSEGKSRKRGIAGPVGEIQRYEVCLCLGRSL